MSKFLKFSLVSVLAIGTFSIAPTFAQEDGDVEEVIVTGSKIKKVDIFDSSKPLEVVDAAQIERTGLNNIGDVLQNLTSSDGTGIRPVTTATNDDSHGENDIQPFTMKIGSQTEEEKRAKRKRERAAEAEGQTRRQRPRRAAGRRGSSRTRRHSRPSWGRSTRR